MNILLWILQILLALHTIMGAIWKMSNSQVIVDALGSIPHTAWIIFSVVELICSLALILPLISKKFGRYVSLAAIFITAEMILFCCVQIFSGFNFDYQTIYWLVVAIISAFLAYGRYSLRPIL